VVYISGLGVEASDLGKPDIGFTTEVEITRRAAIIVQSVSKPVICDADTGYGGLKNVWRTVRDFEAIGVSAIHVEDQTFPKRCGALPGKSVISLEENVKKLKTMLDARRSDDFLIIARTDAIATHGFDHAIERAKLFADAGADIIFIEAPRTKNQVKNIPKLFNKKPLLINLSPRTPNFSAIELKEMGYSIAIYPGVCLAATILACREDVRLLKETGQPKEFKDVLQSFAELNEFLGVPYYNELEKKYDNLEE